VADLEQGIVGVRVLRCEHSYCYDDRPYQKGDLVAATDRLVAAWAQIGGSAVQLFAPASEEERALFTKGVPEGAAVEQAVVPATTAPVTEPVEPKEAGALAGMRFEDLRKMAKKAGLEVKGKNQAELVALLVVSQPAAPSEPPVPVQEQDQDGSQQEPQDQQVIAQTQGESPAQGVEPAEERNNGS
jgi:hypothetical protein